jgi:aspartyl-tRNA(Asn)/glutamyl-tRNA(Gln) amidotransferase subunit C
MGGKMKDEVIKKEKIKEIADLARIKISEEEAEKMEKDFKEILEYFSSINELVKEHIELKSHFFEAATVIREDRFIKQSEEADKIVNEFSKVKGRYAKAPKTLK